MLEELNVTCIRHLIQSTPGTLKLLLQEPVCCSHTPTHRNQLLITTLDIYSTWVVFVIAQHSLSCHTSGATKSSAK